MHGHPVAVWSERKRPVVETTAHRACGRTDMRCDMQNIRLTPREAVHYQHHPQQGDLLEVMSLPSCIYQKRKLHTTKGMEMEALAVHTTKKQVSLLVMWS
ncbi:hypothetical protein J4Q44_G00164720 [Coregonus suidteri]|uniref:Uncharacterized protein n=1 Tax=Coregonus suidteri TaxID=861788 RepID=A0AAN8LK73_9TELE